MSTPPPPPSWPTSTGQPTGGGATAGPQSWWTGGRILVAIAIVGVLMTLAAVGGFVAGAAWGGFTDVAGAFEDFEDFGDDGGGPTTSGPTVDGDLLRVGTTVTGTLPEDGAAEHVFPVETRTEVQVKLSSDDFDTVLTVFGPNGQVRATNDDVGIGTDSQVELVLEPGLHTVVVESFFLGEGDYELSAR